MATPCMMWNLLNLVMKNTIFCHWKCINLCFCSL